jgi:hypothetical protein
MTRSHDASGKGHIERGHIGRVAEGNHKEREAGHRQVARGHLAGGVAGHGHHKQQRDAARGQRHAGSGCGPAQQLLHELRLQHGVGVQHAAHQRHQKTADGEVFVAEKLDVDERILVPPLPPDQRDHAADKQHSKEANEAGGEPVVFFALVEHDLQAAHGDGEEAEAQVVHLPRRERSALIHGGSSTSR